MSRWTKEETTALIELRSALAKEIAEAAPFPDVVGDRRLLRFLRGNQMRLDASIKQYRDFLQWRREYDVDKIRQEIVYGGKNSPMKFPYGEAIIATAPQIVCSSSAVDKLGQPIVVEKYTFNPEQVFKQINIKQYLLFLTYSLEYRNLIMEQLSHIKEQEYLAQYPDPKDRKDGYGVIVRNCTIRDLKGVSLSHVTGRGAELVKAALQLGLRKNVFSLIVCVVTSAKATYLSNPSTFFNILPNQCIPNSELSRIPGQRSFRQRTVCLLHLVVCCKTYVGRKVNTATLL